MLYASGPGTEYRLKKDMSYEEYSSVVDGYINAYYSRTELYRSLHLIFQVIAVVLSASIPIMLNANILKEIRKKGIITIMSLIVAVVIGTSGVFKFGEQSLIYSNGRILLNRNLLDYETSRGLYEKIKDDSISKLNTYKYTAETIRDETERGILAKMPDQVDLAKSGIE